MTKYTVLVKPGCKEEGVSEGDGAGTLVVKTRKRAHDGEANEAVVEILAKFFGVGRTRVRILRGARGRRKVIEVDE